MNVAVPFLYKSCGGSSRYNETQTLAAMLRNASHPTYFTTLATKLQAIPQCHCGSHNFASRTVYDHKPTL